MTQDRLFNYAAFGVLMIATFLGFQSVWGLLFLFWTIPNFRHGRAFLLSSVTRFQDPILFWLIQIVWIVFGLFMIAADFFPAYVS